MDELELERRLRALKATWRIPQDPPLDAMWAEVERQAFPPLESKRHPRWIRTLLPLAATLVLGFGLGRFASGRSASTTTVPDTTPGVTLSELKPVPELFVGVATDYLERVTMLLVTLTDAAGRGQAPEHSTAQARDLLATTRLLLDSPQAGDPRLQALLQDLELVLAQIVRLPARAPQPDVYLIDQTLDQREVLPRLRDLLAENSTSQP